MTDQDIAAGKIQIETKDAVVYLTGSVANEQQLKDAYKVAKKTGGVKDVLNNLRITTQ